MLRLQKLAYIIKDTTYDEISNVSNYHIPLYSEVMDLIAGKKPIAIEIKSQGNLEDDKKIVDYVFNDLKERGIENKTLVISISSDAIIYAKQKDPNIKTGKVYYIAPNTFLHLTTYAQNLIDELERTNAEYLMVHGSSLRTYETIKEILPVNKTLVFWYFDNQIYIVKTKYANGEFYTLRFSIRDIIDKTKAILGINIKEEKGCLWWC